MFVCKKRKMDEAYALTLVRAAWRPGCGAVADFTWLASFRGRSSCVRACMWSLYFSLGEPDGALEKRK